MTIKCNGIYPKIHIPDLPVIKTPLFKKIEARVLQEHRDRGEENVPKKLKSTYGDETQIKYLVEIERRLYCYKIEKQRKKLSKRQTAQQFYKKPQSRQSNQSRGSRGSKKSKKGSGRKMQKGAKLPSLGQNQMSMTSGFG
jgi:hypothetical protein